MYCNRRSSKREWEFAGTSPREASLTVGDCAAEEVGSFKYLGANVTTDGGSTADIKVMFNGRYILQEAREYLDGYEYRYKHYSLPFQEPDAVCTVLFM